MIYLVYVVHILVCFFLILVVLLQQGKGADLSVFGGGATQAAFGARGAATLLHKLTVISFVAFIVTTISIGLMTRGGGTASVMGDAEEETVPVAPVPPLVPGEQALDAQEGAPAGGEDELDPRIQGEPAGEAATGAGEEGGEPTAEEPPPPRE